MSYSAMPLQCVHCAYNVIRARSIVGVKETPSSWHAKCSISQLCGSMHRKMKIHNHIVIITDVCVLAFEARITA